MTEIITSAKVTITKEHHGEITAAGIIDLLRAAGHQVPDNALFYFSVPGGGDWSNTDIEIDTRHPVRFRWSTVETQAR